MTGPKPSDPLDHLRRANPAPHVDDLPSASLARVRARVMEDSITHSERPHRPWRARPIAVAFVATAAALAIVVVLFGRGSVPGPAPDPSGPQVGACVETYSLETLRHRTLAFDGTVVSIAGDGVTFEVNQAFRGVGAGQVTLTATGMTGASITPGGAPTLIAGERYLVAGDELFAWACGFTQPYDAAVAAGWAEALRS